jgi:hypothetical protein
VAGAISAVGPGCIVADSITQVSPDLVSRVIVNGSHGGITAARIAIERRPRAVIFNDAGIGLDQAGVAGLLCLEDSGIPAAAVSHDSARIGDGADMLARGVISRANTLARDLGVEPGQSCRAALACLERAASVELKDLPAVKEQRAAARRGAVTVWILDSASLVRSSDADHIVVTGSHGGLLGGRKATAIKANVLMAFFNDAGIGIEEAGCSRLPALDESGIAAATVAASTARIGEGWSTYHDGVISRCNPCARALGLRVGATVADAIQNFLADESNR